MDTNILQSLNKEYKAWLTTLGFAASSVKMLPRYTGEMLNWMHHKGVTSAREITTETIETFFFQWKKRKNKTTGAGLSQHHINTGITAIHNFIKFLKLAKGQTIHLTLEREKPQNKIPRVLTVQEIQAFYNATYTMNKRRNNMAYGQRDRAMLAIFYGCGLRRNEGNNLLVSDIILNKRMVYVRKGKGSKERFVPLTVKGIHDIEEYLHYGRNWFLTRGKSKAGNSNHLFINIWGAPMKDFTSNIRNLKEEAGIQKPVTLHTFRHSIATHLLQGGMEMEHIRRFLGHASLESTQLYTHIINEQF